MNKIALLVLYNHRYEKNIPIIEKIYEGKFSHLYHIIPFYEGNKENVLPVYESSYQFQSYIAQAYQQIKHENFTHYFVVADDMIIHPQINENNLFEITGIPEDSCFITDFRDRISHPNIIPLFWSVSKKGVEVKNILPKAENAIQSIKRYGLFCLPYPFSYVLKFIITSLFHLKIKSILAGLYYLLYKNKKQTDFYPVIWGYSDILLINGNTMPKFCTNCGCFAALNDFVEFAIPTSLAISTDKITFGQQLKLKYISQLHSLDEDYRNEFEKKYHYDLALLLNNYPQDLFFIHPIKLSKWKTNKE